MSCADQLAYQNGGPATTPFAVFRDSIPLLKLPTSSLNPIPPFPMGISSRGGSGESHYQSDSDFTVVIPDYSLDELQEFFAGQMAEEGWELDGGFVGNKSASGVWFKRVIVPLSQPLGAPAGIAINMLLTAEVALFNLKDDDYSVSLTVSTGNPQSSSIGIRGISPIL